MSSVNSVVSSASMQKWGIPDSGKAGPESSVLERLVWVQYNEKWWPAILYRSYQEMQQHLYKRFHSYVVKAQFALAIMRQIQEKRNVQVARLLGRETMEIIEIEDGAYREFYWYLADILPDICDKSNFDGEPDLFIDVHRALDEVETIFREVTNSEIPLSLEDDGHRTWLERAQSKLLVQDSLSGRHDKHLGIHDGDDDTMDYIRNFRLTLEPNEERGDWRHSIRSSTAFNSQDKREIRSKKKDGVMTFDRVPGDESRDDIISWANYSRSSQKTMRDPRHSGRNFRSDVLAEVIGSMPDSEIKRAAPGGATPRKQEMITKVTQEIDELYNEGDRKNEWKNAWRGSTQNHLKTASTISTVPSQTLPMGNTFVSREDTEQAKHFPSPEALRTSKGRIIPRRGAGVPLSIYDRSGSPSLTAHFSADLTSQQKFQSRKQSPYKAMDGQSLLTAAQQRQMVETDAHDRSDFAASSQRTCHTPFCGLQ